MLLWPLFVDFGKELGSPGTIWHASLASFTAGAASLFAPRVVSWACVVAVAALMTTDLTVLLFGLQLDSACSTVLVSLSIWFFKAFHFTEFLFVALFLGVWQLGPALATTAREHWPQLLAVLACIIILPPDIAAIFWVVVLHMPATVVASRDYCSGSFVIGSLLASVGASLYFDFHGRLSLPTTIAYIVFRTGLYVN